MIDVVICDDHALVRRGIRQTLQEAVDLRVTGEAASYAEVRELLRHVHCDVLLLDLALPGRGGLEVLSALADAESTVRVLVVSMFIIAVPIFVIGFYVSKSGDPAELVTATRMVAQGRKYVTPEMAQMLAETVSRPAQESTSAHSVLSDRELQTLTMIASGKRLSDIAEELKLSPKTVSVYRSRVLEKLNLPNNAAVTVYAIRNQLV